MEKISIPNLKNKASRIGLGTWAIGGSLWGGTDEKISIETIRKALDLEIDFIDTAPAYGKGQSETIMGKALKESGKRDRVILATKAGLNQEGEGVFRDCRPDFLRRELENSLKRLQVDYIDLYQIHWPDPKTPIEQTAETLAEFLRQGKIRAIGVSNFDTALIQKFRSVAPLHTNQACFNLFEREIERDVLPFCRKEKIAVIGYSSLCRGLLSDSMTKERTFKGDDLRKGMDPKFQEPHFSQYLSCAEALKKYAREKYRLSLIALSIRWVLDNGIDIALWGARNPEQLKEIDRVFGWKLSEEDLKEIDAIVAEHVTNPASRDFMAPPIRES